MSARTVPASLGFAFMVALFGCSKQSEGEQCNIDNGNEDCDTAAGLVCTSATDLGKNPEEYSAVCCKPQGQSSHPACIRSEAGAGGAGGASGSLGGSALAGGTAGTGGTGGRASQGGAGEGGGSAEGGTSSAGGGGESVGGSGGAVSDGA